MDSFSFLLRRGAFAQMPHFRKNGVKKRVLIRYFSFWLYPPEVRKKLSGTGSDLF